VLGAITRDPPVQDAPPRKLGLTAEQLERAMSDEKVADIWRRCSQPYYTAYDRITQHWEFTTFKDRYKLNPKYAGNSRIELITDNRAYRTIRKTVILIFSSITNQCNEEKFVL
jgi:hypothetical protein